VADDGRCIAHAVLSEVSSGHEAPVCCQIVADLAGQGATIQVVRSARREASESTGVVGVAQYLASAIRLAIGPQIDATCLGMTRDLVDGSAVLGMPRVLPPACREPLTHHEALFRNARRRLNGLRPGQRSPAFQHGGPGPH